MQFSQETLARVVSMKDAALIFGWHVYYLPFLMKAGHLKTHSPSAQRIGVSATLQPVAGAGIPGAVCATGVRSQFQGSASCLFETR